MTALHWNDISEVLIDALVEGIEGSPKEAWAPELGASGKVSESRVWQGELAASGKVTAFRAWQGELAASGKVSRRWPGAFAASGKIYTTITED